MEALIYSDFVAAMFSSGKIVPYLSYIGCVTIFASRLVLLRTRNKSELPCVSGLVVRAAPMPLGNRHATKVSRSICSGTIDGRFKRRIASLRDVVVYVSKIMRLVKSVIKPWSDQSTTATPSISISKSSRTSPGTPIMVLAGGFSFDK